MVTKRFEQSGRAARAASLVAIGLLLGAGRCAAADSPLALKMDPHLMLAASPSGSTSAAVAFGVSAIRQQILKVRDQVAGLERERVRRQGELHTRERLITELQHVLTAQDGAIGVMQRAIERLRTPLPVSAAPAVVVPEPVIADPVVPAAPPSPDAGFTMDRLLIDGGLMGVIAVLLGWSLYLRSRLGLRRDADSDLRREHEVGTLLADSSADSQAPPDPAAPRPPPVAEVEEHDKDITQVGQEVAEAAAPTTIDAEVAEAAAPTPDDEVSLDGLQLGDELAQEAADPTTHASLTDIGIVRDALAAAAPSQDDDQPSQPEDDLDATIFDAPELRGFEPPADEAGLELELEVETPETAGAAAPAGDPSEAVIDWTQTQISRTAADPNALREADTLIAFEDYEPAKRLLDEPIRTNPNNPEYRLRLVHVQAELGNQTEADKEEEILAAMMDGPLSETLHRVKTIGKDLLPGHPLFDESFKRKADAPDLAAAEPAAEEESILREIFSGPEDGDSDRAGS